MSSLRPRVIPCLQVAGRELFKTRKFKNPTYLGDPINAVKLFNDLECDELVVVDIHASSEGREPDFSFIEEFATEAFMPVAYGGGITSVDQIRRILSIGIEKVVISTAAEQSRLIEEAASIFGSQSIVVSIDVRKSMFGKREVWTKSATHNTRVDPVQHAELMQKSGAGELLLQAVDLEGSREGYDLRLVQDVCAEVNIPVIASGGAGSLDHIREVLQFSAAASAGTMFVMHGKHRAPLISYPRPNEIEMLGRTGD